MRLYKYTYGWTGGHHESSEFRIDEIDIFRFTAVFHPFSLADRMPHLRKISVQKFDREVEFSKDGQMRKEKARKVL